MISNVVSRMFLFFFIMYTARYLGAENFGVLSFAIAFTGIFGVFCDIGMNTLTTREVARNESLALKYFENITLIKVIFSIAMVVIIVLALKVLTIPKQTFVVVLIITLSIIFSSFTGLFNSIFQAAEKMEYISVGQILNSIFMLIGALFAIKQKLDVVSFAYIYVIVNGIILAYSSVICFKKFFIPRIRIDLKFWTYVIRSALPFGLSSLFIIIYFQIDSIMLALMKDNSAVGFYSAAYKLLTVLIFIPSAVTSSLYPVFSKLHLTSKNSLIRYYKVSLKLMLIISIPISIGTTLLAEEIITWIYGNSYIQSVYALKILIWATIPIFTGHVFGTILNSINKQASHTKITIWGTIVNLVLNFILIPKFSYIGAGVATVITEMMVQTLLYYNICKYLSKVEMKKMVLIPFISAIPMSLFILYFKNSNLYALVFTSIIIYFTCLYIMKGITKDEVKIITSLKSSY